MPKPKTQTTKPDRIVVQHSLLTSTADSIEEITGTLRGDNELTSYIYDIGKQLSVEEIMLLHSDSAKLVMRICGKEPSTEIVVRGAPKEASAKPDTGRFDSLTLQDTIAAAVQCSLISAGRISVNYEYGRPTIITQEINNHITVFKEQRDNTFLPLRWKTH